MSLASIIGGSGDALADLFPLGAGSCAAAGGQLGTLFAAALIIYKHDANLQRLVEGTEPKFSFGKSEGDHA